MEQDAPKPQLAIPERFNAAAHLLDRNIEEGRGAKVAIYSGDQSYTYLQLYELANRIGNALREQGVERENRVAILLPDSIELTATFLGAMKMGAVPVLLNTLMRPEECRFMLEDCRAKTVVAGAALWDPMRGLQREQPHPRHVMVVGTPSGSEFSFEKRVADASPVLQAADTSKDDVALWLYTSGTTGFPKAAVHLHHDLAYCAEMVAKGIFQMTEEDITFSASKLFFSYGLGNNLNFPMTVGASAVYFAGRPRPEEMFEAIHRYRPTIFFGVPTLYASMLQVEYAERRFDLSSLRFCVSAGEALPAEIYRRWLHRHGLEIIDGIGSTEVLHIFISNRPGQVVPGSSGCVVPGYEARIVDDGENPVRQGEVGNLMIKGDSTMAYYWNRHEITKKTLVGEWIYTGDQYCQDGDGYYWCSGRSDDMLKVGGMWVSPVEVENTIMEHPSVLEAAVVGYEDEDRMVKPRAFVVLRPGHEPTPQLTDGIQNLVKARLVPYKYPRWVEFVDELPKTSTGKIQRYQLRERGSE